MENAVISMASRQYGTDADAGEESFDFITDGFYSHEDAKSVATYEESELTGLPGTRTSVTVSPECVIVEREGAISSRMEFRVGESIPFLYSTPYGDASMGVRTVRIHQHFNAGGGQVEVEYVLDIEHTVFSRNLLKIQVERR